MNELQPKYTAMPSGNKSTVIEFCYMAGGEPAFICGAVGHVTSWMLDDLETQVNDDEGLESVFTKGEGNYLFSIQYVKEDRGDFGRIEVPSYWLLDLLAFKAPWGDTRVVAL